MRSASILSMTLSLVLVAGDAAAEDGVKPYSAPASLSIDGASVGSVVGTELATFAGSDVVVTTSGSTTYTKKHIGGVKYQDFELAIGPDAGRAIYDWIAASLQMRYARKNGVLETSDGARSFYNALVSEIAFPRLDAGTSASRGISIKLSPEYTRYAKAAGRSSTPARASLFSTSSWRLSLDGVSTKDVRRIDELAIRVKVTENAVGELRDYQQEPGKIEFPNVRLYVSPAGAADFIAWHEDFVLRGNCGDDKEKTGSIELLSSDGKTALVELKLAGVGIFGLREVTLGTTRALQVDLYVERMDLLRKGATTEAAPSGDAVMTVTSRKTVPDRIPSGRRTTTDAASSTTLEPVRTKPRVR